MTASRRLLLTIAAVALMQTGVLAYIVMHRTLLLMNGREIVLPIEPIDPRDPFRGEYVRLNYKISTVPNTLLVGPAPERNTPFYVTLAKTAEGGWSAMKVTAALPSETHPDRVVLKARSQHRFSGGRVTYGIERYYVPEGQGRRLETVARERPMAVRVAVDAYGNAAIKGLIIDGVPQPEEPLF